MIIVNFHTEVYLILQPVSVFSELCLFWKWFIFFALKFANFHSIQGSVSNLRIQCLDYFFERSFIELVSNFKTVYSVNWNIIKIATWPHHRNCRTVGAHFWIKIKRYHNEVLWRRPGFKFSSLGVRKHVCLAQTPKQMSHHNDLE